MDSVADWPYERRLQQALTRTLPKLAPEAREQLSAVITPEALATVAAVLVAWGISHAFGVGEAIDIVIAAVGVLSIGMSVFSGLDYLYDFFSKSYNARTEADLDRSADDLAKAIGILGVQAVLACLFRGRPQTKRLPSKSIPPPRNPGLRYRSTVTYERLSPGVLGSTDRWGNVKVSTLGTADQQAIALIHEGVHSWLTPKLYYLREFRISNLQGSYFKSSLWRYIEEGLAQTIALGRVKGLSASFVGLRFPVQNGYVFLTKAGGYNKAMLGNGVFQEGAGLIASGMMSGITLQLWFKPGIPDRHSGSVGASDAR